MASVDQTLLKVQRILTGPMGLRIQLQGNTFSVSFADASTHVRIGIAEWGTDPDGEPRTLVRLSAPILWEVKQTQELFEWISREGGQYHFGHVVAYDDESNPGHMFLLMTHTLLGNYLDQGELESALWGVLGAADELDDELQQRFGGKRLADFE